MGNNAAFGRPGAQDRLRAWWFAQTKTARGNALLFLGVAAVVVVLIGAALSRDGGRTAGTGLSTLAQPGNGPTVPFVSSTSSTPPSTSSSTSSTTVSTISTSTTRGGAASPTTATTRPSAPVPTTPTATTAPDPGVIFSPAPTQTIPGPTPTSQGPPTSKVTSPSSTAPPTTTAPATTTTTVAGLPLALPPLLTNGS